MLLSQKSDNRYISWRGIHRLLLQGVCDIVITRSRSFDKCLYFQSGQSIVIKFGQQVHLMESDLQVIFRHPQVLVITAWSHGFDKSPYLKLLIGYYHEKRTAFTPLGEKSIGHSSSVAGDAITTWTCNVKKIPELKLWTGYDY